MFPIKPSFDDMPLIQIYDGLNNSSSPHEVLWNSKKLLRAMKGRKKRSSADVAKELGLTPTTIRQRMKVLKENGILESDSKIKLNTKQMKNVLEWHEKRIENEDNIKEFHNRLKSQIDSGEKLEKFEKEGATYYRVEIKGEVVELCANPMARYFWFLDNLTKKEKEIIQYTLR